VTQRDPLYRQTAHLVVTTGRQPVTQTVADILARLPDDLQAVASDAPKPTSDRAAIAAEEIPDERT
jgi:hypothetical protein